MVNTIISKISTQWYLIQPADSYLDGSISVRDVRQKKLVQFFRFLPHFDEDNHVINRPASTTLDTESDRSTTCIKEATHLKKGQRSMNQNKGITQWATHMTDFWSISDC